jgi:urease
MKMVFAVTDGLPMNFAFTGKGNETGRKALEGIVRAGAAGWKLHRFHSGCDIDLLGCWR